MLNLSGSTQPYPNGWNNYPNVDRTYHSETCSAFFLQEVGIAGRTLDFPYPLSTNLVKYPIGERLRSTDPKGNQSIEWNSKYGVVGFAALGKENDKGNVLEGMNTKGLTFSSLTLEATVYQTIPDDEMNKALAISDLPLYVLGNCATIDDVKQALTEVLVWGDNMPPIGVYLCHLIFHDANNNSLVVEYIDGKLKMYDDPVRVLTNDPPFPEQLENLQKYESLNIGFAPGSTYPGTGMIGLPGDFSTQSRFARLATLLKFVKIEKGCGIKVAQQLIGSVEVINGLKHAFPDNIQIYDRTHWKTVSDVAALQIYYQTATTKKWYTVSLKGLDFSGTERTSIRIYHPVENRIQSDKWAISVNDQLGVAAKNEKRQEEPKRIVYPDSGKRWWGLGLV